MSNSVVSDPYFYLLESAENLDAAFAAGELIRDDLKHEGFIHASPAEQLTRVANKHYRNVKRLRCAVVEKAKVRPEVKYEPATGGLYPHIYGPLNMDAVVRVVEIAPGPDGAYAIDVTRFPTP
jgi:uncharacterized protein (DUF952 family)